MTTPRAGRLAADGGLTLPEIAIAGLISAVVFAVFAGVLVSIQRTLTRESERSSANDQARLAVESVDRGIRSASNIFTIDAFDMVAYEERPQSGGAPRCVEWLLDDERRVLRRTWVQADPTTVTGWQVAATDIVNKDVAGGPAAAFVIPPSAQTTQGGRMVEVRVMANPNLESQPGATVTIESSITARNAKAAAGTPPSSPLKCPPPP